jgi:hypothetical protein
VQPGKYNDYEYVTGEAHCCVVLLLLSMLQQCGRILVDVFFFIFVVPCIIKLFY